LVFATLGHKTRLNAMSGISELYLFLTCIGLCAVLLLPLAWTEGDPDLLPRSRLARRECEVVNQLARRQKRR
jgi:hypothetical protein